ncbi:MAG: FHA domain-containing protein [Phycisphaerae bacterium]|nr:FHA domain-containing protein [Phycisphaerae bacterium]
MARLKILTGPLRSQNFELDKKGWAKVIGRGTEKVDIRVPDKAISRRHAEFSFRDGQWAARDLGSSNGTFIDELRVSDVMLLKHGDQIRCGSTVLLFETDQTVDLLEMPPGEADAGPIELEFDPGETMVAIAFDSLQSKQTVRQRQRMMQAGQAALNLSHGIKNLLQAVQSGQDVMDDAFGHRDIDQAKKAWNILKRNLDKIQKLVLDMLKFSKEELPRRQPCQFNRLVETVVQMVRPQADERQVGITVQADEHLGLVSIDPDQMQDVVMNLLLNAIEAVPQQTGQVIVYTEKDDLAKEIILRVSDNGKGIENVRTIFEPFHSEKPHVGTGLGLSIAKKIIEAHRGEIEVQSLPGEGSIFTIRIPIVELS